MYVHALKFYSAVFVRLELQKMCCQAFELRPSLAKIRIMLLHLLSTSSQTSAHAQQQVTSAEEFERKWNGLMPRQPAEVVDMRSHGDSTVKQLLSDSTGNVCLVGENSAQTKDKDELYHQQPDGGRSNADSSLQDSTEKEEDAIQITSHIEQQSLPINSLDSRLNDEIIILDSLGDNVTHSAAPQQPNLAAVDAELLISPIVGSSLSERCGHRSLTSDGSPSSSLFTSTPTKPRKNTGEERTADASCESKTVKEDVRNAQLQQTSFYRTAFMEHSRNSSNGSTTADDVYVSTNQSQHDLRGSSASSTTSSAATTTTDDRSILGPKKFAAMLQTVVTSFDDESGSWSMDNTATSFDALSFDVIHEEDDDDVTDVGHHAGIMRAESNEVFVSNDCDANEDTTVERHEGDAVKIAGNPEIVISNADEDEDYDDDDIMVIKS